jgi:hypothetical protein
MAKHHRGRRNPVVSSLRIRGLNRHPFRRFHSAFDFVHNPSEADMRRASVGAGWYSLPNDVQFRKGRPRLVLEAVEGDKLEVAGRDLLAKLDGLQLLI